VQLEALQLRAGETRGGANANANAVAVAVARRVWRVWRVRRGVKRTNVKRTADDAMNEAGLETNTKRFLRVSLERRKSDAPAPLRASHL
jgi:hypothetical protein